MFIINNCASFHLWWKENLVIHQRVSKYYENDCRKTKPLIINNMSAIFFSLFSVVSRNLMQSMLSKEQLLKLLKAETKRFLFENWKSKVHENHTLFVKI